MNKNDIREVILVAILLLFGHQISAQQTMPNIVVIVADDLGNADVGYNNEQSDVATPNIDQLAQAGVKFTSGYVTAPVCGPSRAGLLTGVYQQRFGFEDNPGPFRAAEGIVPGIPLSQKTLAEYFKPLGYVTACFGKWHVGGEEGDELLPSNRGFDEFYGFLGGASSYFPEDNDDEKLLYNTTPVNFEAEYLTDALAREAMSFIATNQSNPFLIYLAFNAVHGPLQAPQDIIDLYAHIEPLQRRKLCAMQHIMDQNVGLVISKLDELNLSENTLIFFISDNGGKYEDNYSYNYPYRGEKGTVYEGGVRLPFVIKWPKHIAPGAEYTKAVSSLDIVPTALAAAGEDISAYGAFDGVDLLPFINGTNNSIPHNYLFWKLNDKKWAVRDAQYKLVFNDDLTTPMLFDIEADKSETTDLYQSMPAKADELLVAYNNWKSGVLPPQWGWQPSIGDFVKHADEDFEKVVKLQFKPLGGGTSKVVANPLKEGINTSNEVLKITLTENALDWSGAWSGVPRFTKKKQYVHVKVLKERVTPIYFKVEGDNGTGTTALSMNDYSTPGEWQDIVFDVDFYNALVKINIQPDFMVGSATTVYIDDIWFSDNPVPRGAPFNQLQPFGISASNITDQSVTLSWKPVEGAISYKIFKDEVELDEVSTLHYLVPDLVSDGRYDFQIVGVNSTGEYSLYSDAYSVMMPGFSYVISDFDTKTERFNVLGNTLINVVSNPLPDGINASANVLKIERIQGNTIQYAGAWSDIENFDRQLRYLHMMVLKEKISVVRFKMEGSAALVTESEIAQAKIGVWEDLVFDFNALNTVVDKINIQPDYAGSGEAHVMYVDDIIMSNSAEARKIVDTSIGDDLKVQDSLTVYPIPAQNMLYITRPDLIESEITIIDMSGKSVLQMDKQSASNGIYIRSLPSGMYVLKCIYNGEIKSVQLLL